MLFDCADMDPIPKEGCALCVIWLFGGYNPTVRCELETLNGQAVVSSAKERQYSMLRQLVAHTIVRPNFSDMSASTALAEAADYGYIEAAKLLLKGIDVNTRVKQQPTLLWRALETIIRRPLYLLVGVRLIVCLSILGQEYPGRRRLSNPRL